MTDQEQGVLARARQDVCLERSRVHGISEARKSLPDVSHIIVNDPPTVFGWKWRRRFVNLHIELMDKYGEGFADLLRLSAMLFEYQRHFIRHYMACTNGLPGRRYIEADGAAFVFFDALEDSEKPRELLPLTDFKEYPSMQNLVDAMSLIWFYQAAECWQRGDQETAFDWLYEALNLRGLLHGDHLWGDGRALEAKEGARIRGSKGGENRYRKAEPLKEKAYKADDANPDKSAAALARELLPEISKENERLGRPLSPLNLERRVADWIRRRRKEKASAPAKPE